MTIEERNSLVVEHLYIAHRVALDFCRRHPNRLRALDDCKQYCAILLMRAADEYEPEKGPYKVWAFRFVRWRLADMFRDREVHRRGTNKLRRNKRRAGTANQQNTLGISEAEVQHPLMEMAEHKRNKFDDRDDVLVEFPGDDGRETLNRRVSDIEAQHAIRAAGINPRHFAALHLHAVQGFTMREIGKLFGVNESRVSQLANDAKKKLRSDPRLKALAA